MLCTSITDHCGMVVSIKVATINNFLSIRRAHTAFDMSKLYRAASTRFCTPIPDRLTLCVKRMQNLPVMKLGGTSSNSAGRKYFRIASSIGARHGATPGTTLVIYSHSYCRQKTKPVKAAYGNIMANLPSTSTIVAHSVTFCLIHPSFPSLLPI